jgi:hypothetical protein
MVNPSLPHDQIRFVRDAGHVAQPRRHRLSP